MSLKGPGVGAGFAGPGDESEPPKKRLFLSLFLLLKVATRGTRRLEKLDQGTKHRTQHRGKRVLETLCRNLNSRIWDEGQCRFRFRHCAKTIRVDEDHYHRRNWTQ